MPTVSERTFLAGVRFRDPATRHPITTPLRVASPGAIWFPNRSGVWVLQSAEGVHSALPTASLTTRVEVSDPAGTYLPRAFELKLPRKPADDKGDLFEILEVELPRSTVAPLRPGWAALRVHARLNATASTPTGSPLEGVLLHVSSDERPPAWALTDARGEAIVAIPGLPLFSVGASDVVLEPQTRIRLRIVYELPQTDLKTGRRRIVADPVSMFSRLSSLKSKLQTLTLEAGEQRSLTLTLPRS